MNLTNINGKLFKKMIIAAYNELNANKQLLDSLNVFPVPDGDTGTNMSLTMLAAAKEVEKLENPNVYEVAKAASNGSLRGARGNSGVILSQLFRGFAKGLEGKQAINADDLAFAFIKASETAYKAVMKPKEGTILTIAAAISEKAIECSYGTDNIVQICQDVLGYANIVLENTKNMLLELRQAGVVDAGGKGLLCILEGAAKSIYHKVENEDEYEVKIAENNSGSSSIQTKTSYTPFVTSNTDFGYCTEFLVNINKPKGEQAEQIEARFKQFLSTIGDSIVVVCDDNILKVHVHTKNPGAVLEYAIKEGELNNIKIENMSIQHTNLLELKDIANAKDIKEFKNEKPKEIGIVSVAFGEGIINIFNELGVDAVIEGGQTMNPSANNILETIEKVNAKNIIVLPNNKNIILAAQQAAKLCLNKNVYILKSKTIPQGIAAALSFCLECDVLSNVEKMNEAINSVLTGQVTYAVRKTIVDKIEVNEGDCLCLVDGEIKITGQNLQQCTKNLIDLMIKQNNGQLISIYFGKQTTEQQANEIGEYIKTKYKHIDVDIQNGGQPLYFYIISVE